MRYTDLQFAVSSNCHRKTERGSMTISSRSRIPQPAGIRAVLTLILSASLPLLAQQASPHAEEQAKPMDHSQMDHNADQPMSGMHSMPGMNGNSMNSAGSFLMQESSGTAFQPSAWPMATVMNQAGDWHLMWMGQAFIVDTQQFGSSRAGDKFYSTNWGMLAAVHKVGGGSVMLRGMVSLEPATVSDRRYPLLFQTGETAFGKPIVDGQHPHDFVMELSVQYALPLGEKKMFNVYYAPVGDPALGPVAYPHRASAMELPQATLAHHWEDSTHIANNVVTAGLQFDKVRIEGSGFRGREPNEGRWNIDMGAMDSWSGRLSVFPSSRWMAQVS